jgi:hypothetical protein
VEVEYEKERKEEKELKTDIIKDINSGEINVTFDIINHFIFKIKSHKTTKNNY